MNLTESIYRIGLLYRKWYSFCQF